MPEYIRECYALHAVGDDVTCRRRRRRRSMCPDRTESGMVWSCLQAVKSEFDDLLRQSVTW